MYAFLSGSWKAGHRLRFAQKHPLRPDEWGLVLPMHLGDTYVMCALAEALRVRHGGTRVTAFVKPQQRYVATLFPAIDRIVEVASFREMCLVGRRGLRTGVPLWTHHSGELRDMLGFKGITLADANRARLRLPQDAPLSSPRHPSADEEQRADALLEAHGLPPGRTVLLAPESNTAPEYSLDAWAALAAALSQAGWTPVTNGGPKGYVIPGTARVDIPLDVCIAFVEQAGWLVTMRTGLADVVSSARARLTVFYVPPPPGLAGPTRDEEGQYLADWYSAFSLVRMGLSTSAEEVVADEDRFLDHVPVLVRSPRVRASGPVEGSRGE